LWLAFYLRLAVFRRLAGFLSFVFPSNFPFFFLEERRAGAPVWH
jgi:hypothetical protein